MTEPRGRCPSMLLITDEQHQSSSKVSTIMRDWHIGFRTHQIGIPSTRHHPVRLSTGIHDGTRCLRNALVSSPSSRIVVPSTNGPQHRSPIKAVYIGSYAAAASAHLFLSLAWDLTSCGQVVDANDCVGGLCLVSTAPVCASHLGIPTLLGNCA